MKLNDGIMAANLSSMNPERVNLKALRSGYHDHIQLQTLQQDLQDIFVCPSTCIEPIVTFSVYIAFFSNFLDVIYTCLSPHHSDSIHFSMFQVF